MLLVLMIIQILFAGTLPHYTAFTYIIIIAGIILFPGFIKLRNEDEETETQLRYDVISKVIKIIIKYATLQQFIRLLKFVCPL